MISITINGRSKLYTFTLGANVRNTPSSPYYTDVKKIVAFGQAKNNFPNFQNSKKLTDCNSVQSRRQSGYSYTVTWLTGISQSGLFYRLSSVSPP